MIDMPDPILMDFLNRQAGVEIHISDTAFVQGGKVRVFYRGDEVGSDDDIRKAMLAATSRISRIRHEEENEWDKLQRENESRLES